MEKSVTEWMQMSQTQLHCIKIVDIESESEFYDHERPKIAQNT